MIMTLLWAMARAESMNVLIPELVSDLVWWEDMKVWLCRLGNQGWPCDSKIKKFLIDNV